MRPHVKNSPMHPKHKGCVYDDPKASVSDKRAFSNIPVLKITAFLMIYGIAVVLITLVYLYSGCSRDAPVCYLPSKKLFVPSGREGVDNVAMSQAKQRLPQCLIIGVKKAGTAALLTYLTLHPNVAAKGNEAHFFDNDEFYNQSLEAYRKEMPFSHDGQITIEKTPAYFVEDVVPERVYRMNKTIRLLLILRDPIDRAVSDWLQGSANKRLKNKEVESFEKLALNKDGTINERYAAISTSVYHRYLSRWLEFFSIDMFHITDSEALVENPFNVTWDVEKFLGLEHRVKPDNFYFNKTKGFYCINSEVKTWCMTPSKGRSHPKVDPGVIKTLKMYFAPHNLKLYKMIGKTFNWDEKPLSAY